MNILIIGGGIFLGRALIDAALVAGHRVTAFSRGKSPLPHPDQIEVITGDRHANLDLLGERHWDAVIDTCAYRPGDVDSLLKTIAERTSHYALISSVSAYADLSLPEINETSPLADPPNDLTSSITLETYGPFKAATEDAARAGFSDPFIVRPGIITGPYDPWDRLTYWTDLIARNDQIILLDDLPTCLVQLIDARDLATWIIQAISAGITGPYNTVGPAAPITMGDLLDTIGQTLNRSPTLHRWSRDQLTSAGITSDDAFPLYAPTGSGQDGIFQVDGSKAHQAGLTHRPLPEIIRDTVGWFSSNRPDGPQTGWPAEKMAITLQ